MCFISLLSLLKPFLFAIQLFTICWGFTVHVKSANVFFSPTQRSVNHPRAKPVLGTKVEFLFS